MLHFECPLCQPNLYCSAVFLAEFCSFRKNSANPNISRKICSASRIQKNPAEGVWCAYLESSGAHCCIQVCSTSSCRQQVVTALVLLDLSSTFDTVDHSTLLTVLDRRFDVRESAMNWFSSYLSDRTQTFCASDVMSGPIPVTCSVPQGSVQGPSALHFIHRRRHVDFRQSSSQSSSIC